MAQELLSAQEVIKRVVHAFVQDDARECARGDRYEDYETWLGRAGWSDELGCDTQPLTYGEMRVLADYLGCGTDSTKEA